MNASLAMPEARKVRLGGLVRSELLKLKGSKVFWLTIGVPLFVLLLASLAVLADGSEASLFLFGGAALYGSLVMPLAIMALTVILAQIEHGPRAWDPLLSLPGARKRIFLLKLVAAAIVVLFWCLLVGGGLFALAALFQAVMPEKMAGALLKWRDFGELMVRMWLASFFMLVIQYGLALFFRGFVMPVLVGIGGIIFAVGAGGSKYSFYFPWLLPLGQMATEDANAELALALGVGGGLLGALILQVVMQRREW